MTNLTKTEFEATALYMLCRCEQVAMPEAAANWTIRSHGDPGEWYVKWSNGFTDRRERSIRAYVRDGKFYYI